MNPRNASCSFCRKSYTDVGPLVEGPGEVYICGECAELCQSIVHQERRRRNPPRPPAVRGTLLRDRLDQLVHGQDEAKQVLVRAAESRDEGRGRVLLLGPGNSTKILLARALAHALEVPFTAGDAQDLVGARLSSQDVLPLLGSKDVVPLLFRLLQASEFDVEAAQRGVVFVDGVERPVAQEALLRLWQEKVCHPVEGLELAVRDILFVCGGAFAGLEESVTCSGRHAEQPMRAEDLTAVGARMDWVDCLAGVARVMPLDEESLMRLVRWVDFRNRSGEPDEPGGPAAGGR